MTPRTHLRLIAMAVLSLCIINDGNAQNKYSKPDNIILLIGDGLGLAQIYSGLVRNHGQLNLNKFKSIGFSKTYSATNFVTESGAGATAISTGHKTYNEAIGIDKDSVSLTTILEYAESNGLSTGLVSTSAIVHATPAAFIAHEKDRNDYEGIAEAFLKTDIDVFIGGGRNYFAKRRDARNLIQDLRNKNYQVVYSIDSIKNIKQGKLAGLTAPDHNPSYTEGRGDMLPASTVTAINILSNNKKGLFLMVEGSHIDWGAHFNNVEYLAQEVIDFDRAIGKALEFAEKNKNTLVIVTADHESGGMAILDGNIDDGTIVAKFSTFNHTGVMVPVFAWGPGAELFQGIQENTDLFYKMMSLLGLKTEKQEQ